MEKNELLEKLVAMQEMHIELMQDCNSLKFSYDIKIEKINELQNSIKQKDERIALLERQNAELKKQIAELKQQIEESQNLIPIEVVGGQEEQEEI